MESGQVLMKFLPHLPDEFDFIENRHLQIPIKGKVSWLLVLLDQLYSDDIENPKVFIEDKIHQSLETYTSNDLRKFISRTREITELDSASPFTALFRHTLEELGEFSGAYTAEIGEKVKTLVEPSAPEAVDFLICALSLYFAAGGFQERLEIWEHEADNKEHKRLDRDEIDELLDEITECLGGLPAKHRRKNKLGCIRICQSLVFWAEQLCYGSGYTRQQIVDTGMVKLSKWEKNVKRLRSERGL